MPRLIALVLLLPSLAVASHANAEKPIRIVLVGDSTVASYDKPPVDRPDLTGWGQVFGGFFDDRVTVLNHAQSGASSKSFIREKRWAKALAAKPDYVFIQFGHNDCPGKGDRSTDPNTDFQDYLRQYIDEARAAGAKPILVTPVARRTFKDGKIVTGLQPYADAMLKVGKDRGTPVIDLHTAAMRLFDRLGDAGSADLTASANDRTHFSHKGAEAMARLVVEALPQAAPELTPCLKTPRNWNKTAPETALESSKNCYLFSYFVGNGEDGLHLAHSADGYKWEALGGGKSFLAPQVGKSKLMRDPCLLRASDGTFQLVWTDSWNSRTIGHASSNDLLHWSEQQAIGVMEHEPQAMNCWAPELVYDEAKQQYVIFWATTIPGRFPQTDGTGDGECNHRIYCTTTKDFKTFTPTRLFFDGGFNVIDATMLHAEGKYYLIVKDETLKPVKKNLRIAVGDSPEGPFGLASAPFTSSWVEGPSAIRIGDDYVVYFDCYTKGHYGAARSRNLKDWEDITSRVSFPQGTLHGTVLRVPKSIVDKLSEAR